MNLKDFSYHLPPELIAQVPPEKRGTSRLMVLDRASGKVLHSNFSNLPDFLRSGDIVVFNNSRVIPARCFATKEPTGARIELLFLKDMGQGAWRALCRPAKRLGVGTELLLSDAETAFAVTREFGRGEFCLECLNPPEGGVLSVLEKIGYMPLPPYIKRDYKNPDSQGFLHSNDITRYQTVFSRDPGSVAAPTAGLHFSDEIMQSLDKKGVGKAFVTLHVGLGTFLPLEDDAFKTKRLHTEYYSIEQDQADLILAAKAAGGRVVCVGTTATRVLEGAVARHGCLKGCSGETDIFIFPPYDFAVADALVTNFHLPESSLLLLVSAFCGRDKIMEAYRQAVEQKYRFFSYGDAMFIG